MAAPQNPLTDSTPEPESIKTTHFQEPDNPSSPQNPPEPKKTKPDNGSAQESAGGPDPLGVNKSSEAECRTTVPTKSNGTVEDSSSSGRERLKRHRVEVAGRVWIPDMWGQEDLLKDWTDCAAFDASLANSTIVVARDSLMGEGRRSRATSTRLRIQ